MQKLSFLALGVSLMILGAGCADSTSSLQTDSTSSPQEGSTDSSTPEAVSDTTTPATQESSPKTPVATSKTWTFPGVLPAEQIHGKQIRIATAKGDIVFKLFDDTAPNTVSNFVSLASGGYYDGLIFHRVIDGFMIQGGDPTGTGSGGPGYKFPDELKDSRTYMRGTVAMANSGPNTNGSQFFIMHVDYPLPHSYSIFGQVIEGMDVVDAIATTPTGAQDRPMENQTMTTVSVEDVK